MLQRVDLGDRVSIEPAATLAVTGFAGDTLVRDALGALAAAAGVEPRWRATIAKRIPVAAGLGGGSSDAATALRLANETLDSPAAARRAACARRHARCGRPVLPGRRPTARTRRRLRARGGRPAAGLLDRARAPARRDEGVDRRRLPPLRRPRRRRRLDDTRARRCRAALAAVKRPRDLAALPPNDLASSPLAAELRRLGAFRADVSGAGPAVYGLFHHRRHAGAARQALRSAARTWLTVPVWYG